jgi:hypothetical protein
MLALFCQVHGQQGGRIDPKPAHFADIRTKTAVPKVTYARYNPSGGLPGSNSTISKLLSFHQWDWHREAQASFAGTAFFFLKEVPANGRRACQRPKGARL